MSELMGEKRLDRLDSPKKSFRLGRSLTLMIVLAIIGGSTLVVSYSYEQVREKGAVAGAPIVRAQEGPTKIKPKDSGGLEVPHQNKQVYDLLDPNSKRERVENLLPKPETAALNPPQIQQDNNTKTSGPALRKVPAIANKTLDQKLLSKPVKTKTKSGQNKTKVKIIKDGLINRYNLQFGSLRSKKAANTLWMKLKKEHPTLFKGLTERIVRAEVPKKGTYFRLQVGTIKGKKMAQDICSRAKKRKIGCFLVKLR